MKRDQQIKKEIKALQLHMVTKELKGRRKKRALAGAATST